MVFFQRQLDTFGELKASSNVTENKSNITETYIYFKENKVKINKQLTQAKTVKTVKQKHSTVSGLPVKILAYINFNLLFFFLLLFVSLCLFLPCAPDNFLFSQIF